MFAVSIGVANVVCIIDDTFGRDVFIDEVEVIGDRRWPNNDGIDPTDSSDIIIQNSLISTGDDCICIVTHTPYP